MKNLERCNICGHGHYSGSKCDWCNYGEHRYFLALSQALEEKIEHEKKEIESFRQFFGEVAAEREAGSFKANLFELSFIKEVHSLSTLIKETYEANL